MPRWLALGAALVAAAGLAAWYYRTGPAAPAPAAVPAKPLGNPGPAPAPVDSPGRFEFYDVLPDAEVRVTEDAKGSHPATDSPPLVAPGAYVLQAGAFPNFAEADKVKAKLALLGVVSEIQEAEAKGTTFHRVRIGPIEDLDELNRLRARLRQNRIDFIVIPVEE